MRSWSTDLKLILEVTDFEELQATAVSAKYQPIDRQPGMGQVVERVDLQEGKLLESAFGVAEELEELLAHSTHLSVVLWVEGDLGQRCNFMGKNIREN